MADRLYFRQLLSGRDFAVSDSLASQMVNFVYLIGDRETAEAVIVDPAYAVAELIGAVEADGLRLTGVLATHHHPDHVGGSMMGLTIAGISELLAICDVPIHVQRAEVDFVTHVTGVGRANLVAHDSGDTIALGAIGVQVLHTPGHTPGSQCFLLDGRLVSGDTLFLEGCGRTDLPGASPEDMYDSLQRLTTLPDDTVVFPGHRYSMPCMGALGAVKEMNYVFKPKTREQWLTAFGQS